jgi:hypothetical protein
MSSRLLELRERRLAIVAACDQDRRELADAFGGLERELHFADRIVRVAQRVKRNRAVMGVLAAGLVLAPILAKKWVRRAAWWLPVAIQGYRIIQSSRGKRRARRSAESTD